MADATVRKPLRLIPQARAPAYVAPRALSPLVGRETELGQLAREAEAGKRIVTVLGPPGIGKTRLALACLELLGERFATSGGAWFCDLTQATTESGLGFAVLSVLRGRLEGDRTFDGDAIARVGEVLRDAGRTLLILDNFEQLTFAAATVERWCQQAPALTVVVTSRERLGVAGEVVIDLPPLVASPAVELFLQRMSDAGGSHGVDPGHVLSLVQRLEGIPLAIELAAARTRLMTVEELDRRLASGQRVLESTRAKGRHATLESAIAWSWELLPPAERLALSRCSVFAGGFALDVAEDVVGTDAVALLGALRDKSLIHVDDRGRLALYVSVRDFAREKLEAFEPGEADRTRHKHAHAFADLARRFNIWREMLERVPDPRVSDLIRREKDNVVAAIDYARGASFDPRLRAHLAVAAAQLHAMPAEACLEELTRAIDALGKGDVVERALVLFARQSVRAQRGQYDDSLADLAELSTTPNLPLHLVLLARAYEGIQLRHSCRPQQAWERHTLVQREVQKVELPRVAAMNTACMGRLAFDLGDAVASRRLNGEAMALADALGDRWIGALALANLAQLEQEEQRFDRAQELLAEAIDRLRHVGEIYEAVYSSACGDLFFEWGKYEIARQWYTEGARIYGASMRTHRIAALASASWAALEAHDGDHAQARRLIAEARRIAARADNTVVQACVELHGASVDVLGADADARPALADRWRARVTELADASTPMGAAVATNFEARFALRIALRMLERAQVAARLRVDRWGSWFEVDGSARVALGRRGSLRRILAALAAKRVEAPGRGLKQSELATIGWPGERVLVDAAATRVRVAIATLRRLGLRSCLLTNDDGYLLDAAVQVDLLD